MNSSVTSLGEAFSWCEIAGRIGSTRPIPMKETTQAKATAKTAFGCLKGFATPVMSRSSRYSISACVDAPGPSGPGPGLGRVIGRAPAAIALGDGQRVQGGQRGDQRGALGRGEPGQQAGHPLRPDHPPARDHRRPASVSWTCTTRPSAGSGTRSVPARTAARSAGSWPAASRPRARPVRSAGSARSGRAWPGSPPPSATAPPG